MSEPETLEQIAERLAGQMFEPYHFVESDVFRFKTELILAALREVEARHYSTACGDECACFRSGLAAVTTIRCPKHYAVSQQNKTEHGSGECGGCIAERAEKAEVERDALRVENEKLREELRKAETRSEQRAAALGGALLDSAVERAEKSEATRDFFANRLNEALGALGYEVPGDTPSGRYQCGMCGPKDVRLLDADHDWALWREKWTAALDLVGSNAERAEKAEAEVERLRAALTACQVAANDIAEDNERLRDRLNGELK